jgi:hypothetical protein
VELYIAEPEQAHPRHNLCEVVNQWYQHGMIGALTSPGEQTGEGAFAFGWKDNHVVVAVEFGMVNGGDLIDTLLI